MDVVAKKYSFDIDLLSNAVLPDFKSVGSFPSSKSNAVVSNPPVGVYEDFVTTSLNPKIQNN